MNDLPINVRDALWQMVGLSMTSALSQAPDVVVRTAPGAWRVASVVSTWMAICLACHGTDPDSLDLFREGQDDAVASGRATSVVVGETARGGGSPCSGER